MGHPVNKLIVYPTCLKIVTGP